MRPGRTQTGMSSYQWSPYISLTFLSIRLHGTGLKMNSDRSDCMLVANLTRVTVVRQDFSAGGRWRVADDGWQVTGSGWQVTGSG